MTKIIAIVAKLKGQSKALSGIVAVLAMGVSFNLFTGNALIVASAVVAAATYLGIYHAPYATTKPAPALVPAPTPPVAP